MPEGQRLELGTEEYDALEICGLDQVRRAVVNSPHSSRLEKIMSDASTVVETRTRGKNYFCASYPFLKSCAGEGWTFAAAVTRTEDLNALLLLE